MKKILLLISFFIFSNFCRGQLIISQVYEGADNNKWIEITNTSLSDINLSSPVQYKVGIWQLPGSSGNGVIFGSPTNYILLSGTLVKGHKYLIKHDAAASNVPHVVMPVANNSNTTVSSFDGNDALAIFTDTNTIVDAFGVGINYNNISYSRINNCLRSRSLFITTEWTSESLSTISSYSSSINGYIGIHNYSGLLYYNSELSSINKEYGQISPVSSFNLSRVFSNFFSNIPGIAPPPPGITPPVYLYVPADFEVSLSQNFSTAIGTENTPLLLDNSNGIPFATIVYYRLKATATVGNKSGNFRVTFDYPGLNQFDYLIPTHPINLVSAKSIQINGVTANDKVYDGNTLTTLSGTPVLSGVLPSDDANVSLSGLPIANFNDALSGTNKPVTVSGYTISGSVAFNYSLEQPTGLTASILPSGLLSQNIIFETLPTNVVYGDVSFELVANSSTGLPIVFTSSNPNSITISGSTATIVGVGEVVITASQSGNAEYEPALDSSQTIVVLPKLLTVSGLVVDDKIYDATTNATITGGVLEGVINADDVSFVANATFSDSNVGNAKEVNVSYSLQGQSANTYAISNSQLTASITPKELTVSGLTADSKSYDGTTQATVRGVPVPEGLLYSDLFSVTISGNPTAFFESSNIGVQKPISVSGYTIEGTGSANYTIVQPTNLVADITPKSVTISGLTVSNKEYDRTTVGVISGEPILNGIVSGEESGVSLTGSLMATFDTFNVGTNKSVLINGVSLSGPASANYVIEPLLVTASITKKSVTIDSPSVADKNYDGNSVALLSGTLIGVISLDSVGLNLSAIFNDSQVGENKPVTSTSTIAGANVSNYLLIQPQGLTASIFGAPCNVSNGFAYWNGTSANFTSTTCQGLVVSSVERVNNNGTNPLISTSSPSNYAGASGTSNFTASAFVGALNTQTSTYFQFAITPNANTLALVTELSFGSRSNSNGPQAFALRSSVDNFTTTIASGTLSPNGLWSFNTALVSQTSNSNPVTYRLYGCAGVGGNTTSIPNWRIDDLKVTISVTSASALSSPISATVCSGSNFNYIPTTTYPNPIISWKRPAVEGISNEAITTSQYSNPDEVLINTTNLPIDVIYNFVIESGSCSLSQDVTVAVNPSTTWYRDADEDGFGNATAPQVSCDQPTGFVLDGTDCDDSIYSLTNTCNTLLNLKLFVQGYYTGQNQMNSLRTNPNNANQTYVDDVTVELRDAVTLELIDAKVTPLYPDGSVQCAFSSALNGVYYISVKGSNSVKTWSATPIAFGTATVDYDFSDASNKAFGDNMIEVSSGVWALISGDINSDGNVDNADFSSWETDANEFAFGVYVTDLNGDGNVDNADFSIWEANANNFVFSISPTP